MANYAATQALSGSDALKFRLSQWLEVRKARREHRRIFRSAVRELRALSNRELADLGMHRSMIKSIALEAADQKVKM